MPFSHHGGPSASRTLNKQPLLFALALVLITLALYSPVRHHPFVNYDDGIYVTNNDHVKSGFHRETIKWAMTSYDAANWHPVTWLSHMLDYQLFKDNAAGHHDVNLLLHAVNVALLFWVLMRATGREGPSLMVAALFALHPINVETVVWIAERKNLLSMMFFLLALGAWGWYARQPHWSRYLVVAFLFALGLMSKPQVVTLPFVLLLWDYWPLQRMFATPGHAPGKSFLDLLLEKLPLLALSAGSAILTVKAQQKGGGFNPDYTLFQRMENAAVSYLRYIGKTLWPSHLAPMYPHPGTSLQAWQAGLALLVLIAISRRGCALPAAPLSAGGVAVVSGHSRTHDRVAASWPAGDGRPLCVSAFRRPVHHAVLGGGRLGAATAAIARVAGDGGVRSAAGVSGTHASADRLLGRQRHLVDPYRAGHPRKLCRRGPVGRRSAGGRTSRRRSDSLSASAGNLSLHPPALMFVAVQNQQEGRLREAIAQYQQALAASQNSAVRAEGFRQHGPCLSRPGRAGASPR